MLSSTPNSRYRFGLARFKLAHKFAHYILVPMDLGWLDLLLGHLVGAALASLQLLVMVW